MNIDTPEINKILKDNLTSEELALISFFREMSIENNAKLYVPWHKYRSKLIKNISEEQFKTLYKSKKTIKFLELCFDNEYVVNSIFRELHGLFPHLTKDILKNCIKDSLIVYLIGLGFHTSIQDINNLSKSEDPFIRLYSASRCDWETLFKLRKDSDKKVRSAVYKRLGPDEYLEEMLVDKNMEIRLLAAQCAPMHYPKFKDMAGELSKKVFLEVAKKINVKHIPYILGNRNTEDKYIKKILSNRLSTDNISFNEEE